MLYCTEEMIKKMMPTIRKLVKDKPDDVGMMLELEEFLEKVDKTGKIDEKLFNRLVDKIPLIHINAYRKYGLDIPSYDYL